MVGSRDLQGLIPSLAEPAVVSKYEQLLLRQVSCHPSKQMERGYRSGNEWKHGLGEK